MRKTEQKLHDLAARYGAEIEIAPNGRIYIHAPEGQLFRSSQSATIGFGGGCLIMPGATLDDLRGAYAFFENELREGFEPNKE